MKLKCIKSVQMKGERTEDRYQAFTEGNEYNARKGSCKGLNGDPWEVVPVLRTKNDKGESHIIKHLNKDTTLDDFFSTHFIELRNS
ncbi:hypothetical protein [Metabacillus litoralis]|uniref:hypothetical protein n=1 Tax=Metabacillus litoralis TaxID=152268 RepID=UPI00203EDCBD|nr:hypothetical protein [Metabacillus litoralis]MCM3413545.1 hypothetical protein [Metabacillus litoralis]